MSTCTSCKQHKEVQPHPEYSDELVCADCLEEEQLCLEARAQQLDWEEGRYGYEKDFFRE